MSLTSQEISSQPETWRKTTQVDASALVTEKGRVAVVGCGTSWFMAQAYARMRELKTGEATFAYTATEFPMGDWQKVICISRSGTTTEIVDLLRATREQNFPNVLITAVTPGPGSDYADEEITLAFADEESVVQTRFATTALLLLLSTLGEDVQAAAADCEKALQLDIPERWVKADQISFLGTGWTIGLANEAALKNREASQSWAESYPAMEYRHGPISIAQPGRLVWAFGKLPAGLAEQVAQTGAELVTSELHPLAHLVLAQRLAVARAEDRGLNPDTPRNLTRSVILAEGQH
ncbi:SIS domain-containing protein [Winkia sp. ACRQY]|uniref:SIS domain-containing protein n=1 Tax=Winkia TaxID=2692118 RepID=UPI001EF21476|nr:MULTISPECIES: SIS domain-containing protein [Winkia]MBS5946778.1 SIS domain-containing protein [Winkia neuii]MCG7303338.1 SIS domain-containing protein [Winkia sp. ACRQY]